METDDALAREHVMRADLTLYTLNQRFIIIADWLLAARETREDRASRDAEQAAAALKKRNCAFVANNQPLAPVRPCAPGKPTVITPVTAPTVVAPVTAPTEVDAMTTTKTKMMTKKEKNKKKAKKNKNKKKKKKKQQAQEQEQEQDAKNDDADPRTVSETQQPQPAPPPRSASPANDAMNTRCATTDGSMFLLPPLPSYE